MTKEKIIGVIGDIHGCYSELCVLYKTLLTHTDDIYSVGDLIDRGRDSKSVIHFCIDNNIKPVMGNHEDMLIRAIRKSNYEIVPGYETNLSHWQWNGGVQTIFSYLGKKSRSFRKFTAEFRDSGHYDFISKFPLKIELDNCIISHGGIKKNKPPDNVLWNREIPSKLKKIQIIGHTPTENVYYKPNHYMNIDTGCVFGGKLTAVVIDTKSDKLIRHISVPSEKKRK
jgi:diadenosine tetraphosphatase ApaH/serine/threonine PP2A family protein phosphatase